MKENITGKYVKCLKGYDLIQYEMLLLQINRLVKISQEDRKIVDEVTNIIGQIYDEIEANKEAKEYFIAMYGDDYIEEPYDTILNHIIIEYGQVD